MAFRPLEEMQQNEHFQISCILQKHIGKEHLVPLMTNSVKHYYSGSSWKMSNI